MSTVPVIELYKDSEGDWRWRFVAANGRIVADSAEGYKNKTDAKHGIMLFQESVAQPHTIVELE